VVSLESHIVPHVRQADSSQLLKSPLGRDKGPLGELLPLGLHRLDDPRIRHEAAGHVPGALGAVAGANGSLCLIESSLWHAIDKRLLSQVQWSIWLSPRLRLCLPAHQRISWRREKARSTLWNGPEWAAG